MFNIVNFFPNFFVVSSTLPPTFSFLFCFVIWRVSLFPEICHFFHLEKIFLENLCIIFFCNARLYFPFHSHQQKLFRLYLHRRVYRRNHLGKPPMKSISTSATVTILNLVGVDVLGKDLWLILFVTFASREILCVKSNSD